MKTGLFSFHGLFDSHLDYSKLTFNNHQQYCKKYGIDFLSTTTLIDKYNLPVLVSFYKGTWMRFYINQLLDDYDAIIWVDSDVLFTKLCPKVFEIAQKDKFCAVVDFLGEKYNPNNGLYFQLFSTSYPKVYPCKRIKPYFNAGVIIAFKCHKHLFDTNLVLNLPNITPLGDQDFLNWMTSYYNVEMMYLPKEFNYSVSFQSEQNFKNANIIHCNRIGVGNQSPQRKMIDIKKLLKTNIKDLY